MKDKKNPHFSRLFKKLRHRERPSIRLDERYLLNEKENFLTGLIRTFRIGFELMRSFYFFRHAQNCITIFGSARFKAGDHYYEMARQMARKIIEAKFNVMTGGGPGIMEAATIGTIEAGSEPYACGINIAEYGGINAHINHGILLKYFFVRKMMLTKYSIAFIAMPGGFGTLDEIFEIITLKQTGKLRNFPLVLFGSDYWQPLIDFIQQRLIANGAVEEKDLKLIHLTDSIEDAIKYIKTHLEKINDK